jgi:hypothetical protein
VKFSLLVTLLMACIFAGARAHAATLHVDSFDASVEDWVTGGALVTYSATGGMGGGFVRLASFSHMAAYNFASRWTGSFASIGANEVRADLMAPTTSPPLEIRIVLFGEGEARTADRWTSAVPQTIPNDGVWRSYAFSLAEADLVAPGSPGAVYGNIMGGVGRVMFRHDAGTPNRSLDDGEDAIEGTLGLDNVELAMSVTEPILGDFNGDLLVNAADLNDPVDGWRARFAQDLDGNAFLDWQRNLTAPAASPASTTVPEPVAIAQLISAAALVLLVTRNQRSRFP